MVPDKDFEKQEKKELVQMVMKEVNFDTCAMPRKYFLPKFDVCVRNKKSERNNSTLLCLKGGKLIFIGSSLKEFSFTPIEYGGDR